MTSEDARRSLPAVERVIAELAGVGLPPALVADCARRSIDAARACIDAGGDPSTVDEIAAAARSDAEEIASALLRRVINATGVIIHTNLGRSPLDIGAVGAGLEIATGYSNLEYRMATGERGSRHEHAGSLLARACGAEAGIVVNNNAAAVLLTLAALARGREAVVSRGELVEIGGGFRVPDVMAESGARLVEVGTTNRTRVADYQDAITPDTALLLKVHASNYRIVGFVESTSVRAVADLGPPVVFDAGSGLLDSTTPWLPAPPPWLADEPGIRQAVDDGAAIVTFSGDKLLGGPQAGVIVGRRHLVDQIARHPLARAVRADKLTLASLQSVALSYLSGQAAALPLWRMAAMPLDSLRERAEHLATSVGGLDVVDTEAVVGGGSLPGQTMPSVGVAIAASGAVPGRLAGALRDSAVVARVDHDAVICDLRTVDPGDDDLLATALKDVLARIER